MAYIGNNPAELVTELDNGVVTTTKLANDAVTAAKIVDGTIVADDLATGIITNAAVAANAAIAATKLAVSGGSNITLTSDGTFNLDATVDVTGGYSVSGNAVITSARAVNMTSGSTTGDFTIGGNLGVGTGANTISHQLVSYKGGANANYVQIASGATGLGATNGLRLGVSSAGVGEIYSQSASPVITLSATGIAVTGGASVTTSLGIGTPANSTAALYVVGAPTGAHGALAFLRNSTATSSNTSFGGVHFSSSPGTDYSIGKANVNGATSLSFRNGNSGASLMELSSAGDLVVGNTSLDSASSVGFTAAGNIRQVFASGVANDSIFGAVSGVSNGFQILQDTSNNQTYKFFIGGTPSVTINPDRKVDVGNIANQTIAILNARFNGAAIEFGHANNTAGYYGTLGSYGSSGHPYIGFSCDSEEGANTFTTRGHKGNIIRGSLSGDLEFLQVTTANAVGQTPVNRMFLSANGGLGLGTTDTTDSAWGSAANNTEFAMDGNGGYGVIHLRGTGAGSTDTRYSIGCGDSKFYMAYNDVTQVHRITVHGTEVEIKNNDTAYALKITTAHGFGQIGALNSSYLHHGTDRGMNYFSKRCEASGGFHTYSDERLKENITPIDSALSKVEQMNGVTFNWIDPARGGGDTGKQFGVIAQNMAAIDSELPSLNPDPLETDENINSASKDTDYYTMDYSRITPFLIEAIKELKEELNTATARIAKLENN